MSKGSIREVIIIANGNDWIPTSVRTAGLAVMKVWFVPWHDDRHMPSEAHASDTWKSRLQTHVHVEKIYILLHVYNFQIPLIPIMYLDDSNIINHITFIGI